MTAEASEGPRNRLLSATISIFDLWRTVLRGVEAGQHPAPDYLDRLTQETGGVPGFAQWYTDGLASGLITRPRGRPTVYLEPWEVKAMADLDYVPDLAPRQRVALSHVDWMHDRLASYETRNREVGRPGRRFRWLRAPRGGLALRYEGRRGIWKVQRPREQARALVARRYGVSAATIRDWERLDRGYIGGRSHGKGHPMQPHQ